MILAPVGNQLVLTVDKRSSIKEVGHFIKTVVIQTVGTQHLSAMAQHHILTGTHHLHLTIILGTLTYQGQCITLTEMNMSESLHRIGAFIEISTVAGEMSSLMAKGHMAFDNLGIGIRTIHIKLQFISMYEVDALVCGLGGLTVLLCGKHT